MNREVHVRFCEGLGVQFPRATRLREGLVIACECVFCWYWLADLCQDEGIEFVLGHAL